MAYGKKYFSSIKSNNNLDYYLEIWVADHTGTSTELTLGAGGPVIEYETDEENRFSPIISSSCKIPYLVENSIDSQFIDFLRNTYQEKQVYIHIYRASSSNYSGVAPLWSGFLIMDLSSGQDKSFPYVENLKFVDGLALLKNVDFVDLNVPGGSNPPFEERVQGNYAEQNMYFGPGTYIFWIREILLKAGAATTSVGATQNYTFTTSVNWYNGDMDAINQSADPLEKTKCTVSMFHTRDNEGVFFPDNCYNVLKELLRHWGARITYWKNSFYIVQIPEYITAESGTISSPVNNNSRIYNLNGAFQASQNHLGSTYNTRYFQEISNDKISKLTGTKYDYLPIVKQVNGEFLSFSSRNYYGGFPFGADAPTQEVYQGTIHNPSAADSLWLSIPLDWHWDLTNAPAFPSGHTKGWWCSIKFNFYASDGTTTYYLQYSGGANGTYYWEDSANWVPLGNKSPKYICRSKNDTETAYVGFEQSIPFVDGSGNPITMNDTWSFYLDIEDYGTGASNPGSFYINFSGYTSPQRMRNPNTAIQVPANSGNMSGTVFWTNSLESQGQVNVSTIINPSGFNAGTQQDDIRFANTSPFLGLLQLLKNNQQVQVGQSLNTINTASNAKQNTAVFNFNQLLWGDSVEYARSSLQVDAGVSGYVNTNASGLWGRATLTGTKTFTQLLLDEFLYGQTKIVTTPNMRLAVGVQNKNETQGGATRPRYVNPIGKLRELRTAADLEYFFRRGSFYILSDEWDYEGYQILRNVVGTSTQNNNTNNLNALTTATSSAAPRLGLLTQQLTQNSPIAYMRQTVGATGADVVINGNFNTASNWTLGDGWTIDATAKKAKFAATGSTSDLVQSVLTQELTYQINFSIEVTAGTLLVKAGSSGQFESITSSGNYSVYLNCQGSNDIKFTAGTTFTGTITYISARDQKSLTSVPIEAIGSTVFKTGDTFNLVSENNDVPLELTVTADQSANDTTISVASTALYEDITASSYLLINQDDLSAQYQNKTKGTVAGFGIDADGISKGGIEITGWLNSDTMSGAAITNVPTALSVKNYVDAQVGSSDTLEEVTANGNSTSYGIEFTSTNFSFGAAKIGLFTNNVMYQRGGSGGLVLSNSDGSQNLGFIGNYIRWEIGSAEKMRLTSTGLGIGTSSPNALLDVNGEIRASLYRDNDNTAYYLNPSGSTSANLAGAVILGGSITGTTATFSGQVTIPATPVASTDAASKGYVDAQVSATDSLQEVTDNGNTTTNSITFAGGTSTADITGQSITLGDGSTDEKLRVYYNDNSYVDLHGYGIYFNRSFSYIRPNINNTISLLIGSSTQNFFNIRNYAVTHNWFNASSELMRLNSTGLGIGTTSPSEKLEVSEGFILTSGSGTSHGFELQRSGFDTFQIRHLDGNFTINNLTDSRKDFTIDGSGATTLTGSLTGTTATFSGDLQVDGGDVTIIKQNDAPTITLLHDGTNPTTNDLLFKMQFQSDYNGSHQNWGKIELDTNSSNVRTNMDFYVKSTLGSEQLALRLEGQPSAFPNSLFYGNVLIGTTTDSGNKLEVAGGIRQTANNPILIINNQGSSQTGTLYFRDQFGGAAIGARVQTAGGALGLRTATSGDDDVVISSTGNVGIGVANPTEKLHVVGDALITGDSHADAFKPAATGEPIKFKNFGSTEVARITDGGNLLLGTTTDNGDKLRVEGDNPIILIKDSNTTIRYSALNFNTNGGNWFLSTGDSNTGNGVANSDLWITRNKTGSDNRFRFHRDHKAFSIYSGSNQNIYLNANGNSYFNGGNVGIGTSSPSEKLHILSNNATLRVEESGGALINLRAGGTGFLGTYNNTDFGFVTNSSERMRLTSGGNLLIGTTSDDGSSKLQVEGDIKINDNNNFIAGTGSDFKIHHDGVNSYIRNFTGDLYIRNTVDDKDIIFQSDNGTGGTTTYFSLNGSAGYTVADKAIRFNDDVTARFGTGSDFTIKHDGSDTYLNNNTGNFVFFNLADDKDIVFKTDNGSGGTTDYIRLDGSQTTINLYKNVLIGTTTDSGYKLDVNGKTRTQDELIVGNNSGTNATIHFRNENFGTKFTSNGYHLDSYVRGVGNKFSIRHVNSNTRFEIYSLTDSDDTIYLSPINASSNNGKLGIRNANNSTKFLFDTNSGSLLIGTTTDSGVYKLDVAGKARVQSVLELDDVLTLNAISTPADPASGKSSIYMDSADGAIKVKINVGGDVVTRTIASFE